MQNVRSRRGFLTLAGGTVAALAGCLDDDDARSAAEAGSQGDPPDEVGLPVDDADVPLDFDLEEYENSAQRGAEKDAIPSIDDPVFGDVSAGDGMLDPGDPVFGVDIDGDARAYPQRILVSHEIVNDDFGDRGIAVTYCPLTGTAVGFERGSVEFGVSGMLINSNLVMYDRETNTWWPQILGTGVLGQLTGKRLNEIRVTWTTWGRWKAVHPETAVLTEDTGYVRNYDRDPYGSYNPPDGYYENSTVLFDILHDDERHHPKEVVVGARTADGPMAFHTDRLREDRLLETVVGGTQYLAAYEPELDTGYIYRNAAGDTYESQEDRFVTPDGEHRPADGLSLDPVNAFDAMWFAWAAFYPNTVLED